MCAEWTGVRFIQVELKKRFSAFRLYLKLGFYMIYVYAGINLDRLSPFITS